MNYPINKNKIWVFIDFKNNYRFNFLNKIKDYNKNILFFRFRFPGIFYKSNNVNEILYNYTYMIANSTNLWKRAFKLLKPKKIVMWDNLFDDISILIAAKSLGIETVGVSHGPFFKCTKYLMGEKFLKNKKVLKFDKLYVWHDVFKRLLKENSYIYKKSEIFISGWLGNEGKVKTNRLKSNKLILAAHEDNTDQDKYNFLINYYKKKGYKIIFKKRPDVQNYKYLGEFDKKSIELVDEFRLEDYKKCSFAIACKSSMVFEYFFRGIPVIIPNTGFNIAQDFSLTKNLFVFNKRIHKEIIKKKIPKLNRIAPTKEFLNEFY